MKPHLNFLALGLATMAATSTAYPQLIVNGSFEDPAITVGLRVTSLPGWRVSADVDVMPDSYWQAYAGTQSLDLSGDSPPGSYIEQAFPTVIGQPYVLSFYYGNNTDDPYASGQVSVSGADLLLSQDLTHSNSIPQGVGYTFFQKTFIADDSTTALRFTHLGAPTYGRGLILDAVAVTPVPELTITVLSVNLLLSWPEAAGSFDVQQNSEISTANWVTLFANTIVENGQYRMSLPRPTTNMFYRLIR